MWKGILVEDSPEKSHEQSHIAVQGGPVRREEGVAWEPEKSHPKSA